MRVYALLPVLALASLVVPALAADPSLETEEQKTLYALGLSVAQPLYNFTLSAEEFAIVRAGIEDGVLGHEPKIELQEYQTKLQELARTRMTAAAAGEKKKGAAFLAKAAEEKGATKTATGMVYQELTAGTGKSPQPTDRVKVHYTGKLMDGTVFDSSVERGEPAVFPLSRVIKCWTEGVQLMKEGGKAKLICPSDVAYGDRGQPPKIKPGATLIFEVELLEVLA